MLEKKVIVLKEITSGFSAFSSPVSAICRLEKEDGVTCFFLTPVNFRALENGEYYAVFLSNNNQLFSFKLGNRPTYFFHNFDDEIDTLEFSLGVFLVECDIPVLVAYQRSENFSLSIKQFKSLVNNKYSIYSDNDHVVPFEILEFFYKIIDAKPILIKDVGHMGNHSGIEKLKEVIDIIDKQK